MLVLAHPQPPPFAGRDVTTTLTVISTGCASQIPTRTSGTFVCLSVCVWVGARSLTWTLSGALTRCECVGNTNSARPRSAPALFLVEGILILECSRLREVEANLPQNICLLHVSACERDVCEREFRRLSISFNPVVSHSLQRICLLCSCAGCGTASICRH